MSLVAIQTKLNINPSGKLGPITCKAIMNNFKLNLFQAAHFIGQCSHESAGFTAFTENLNYSAEGLARIWRNRYSELKDGKRVPNALALELNRKPELIANHTYANRMGNGDIASGDGFKFRGRGAIQLTGKSNYLEFSNFIKDPQIMVNPDLVASVYALDSAFFFFSKRNLFSLCDKDISSKTIQALTQVINGGQIGFDHRKSETIKAFQLLNS
jgi:putative chitinase